MTPSILYLGFPKETPKLKFRLLFPFSRKSQSSRQHASAKHRRRFRCDREPSRILIRRLKRLKVREFFYARVLSCIPMSSSVYCYVNVTKQQNETTFLFNCCGRIRQSVKKMKYGANRYFLSLFPCNKLMCPCKSETHVANYYKTTDSLQIIFYCS